MTEKNNEYRVLVGKPKGMRPLGRLRHRWENNIKMDLKEIRFGGIDWKHLTHNRSQWRALVDTVTFGFLKKLGSS
jgi:hypothetical protein